MIKVLIFTIKFCPLLASTTSSTTAYRTAVTITTRATTLLLLLLPPLRRTDAPMNIATSSYVGATYHMYVLRPRSLWTCWWRCTTTGCVLF